MVILALGQAIILNKEFRLRSAARIAVLFPWALPLVIYGMIFFLLFQPNFGFGVPLMEQFGLSDIPLTEPAESSLIIIIAYGIRGSPFIALIVLAGMQNIDPSLYNVAKVSGATRWQQFKTVTLPLAYPALLVGVLFSAIAVMKLFALPVTLTGGCTTVPSLSCLVLETFEGQFYGTAAALSFITAIVIGILVVLYLFYSQRRVNL
jgi:multiple sugar transport system permease protein